MEYITLIAHKICYIYITFCFVFFDYRMPESPRWLLNRGKIQEAESLILKAAKINGVNISDEDKTVFKGILTEKSMVMCISWKCFFRDFNFRDSYIYISRMTGF